MSTPAYRHTYLAAIHYLVNYKCCNCGAAITDTEQACSVKVRKKARSEEDLRSQDNEMMKQLKKKAEAAVQKKQEYINKRRYDILDLKCRCPECGKLQPWSSFWPVWGMFLWIIRLYKKAIGPIRYFFVVFGTMYILGPVALLQKRPSVGFTMLILPFIPSAAAFIHNFLRLIQSRTLDDEHQPEISIEKENDDSIIFERAYDGELYDIVSDKNELSSYKKKLKSGAFDIIYCFVLIAGTLIIPKTPAARIFGLQFLAGAFRTVLPLLVGAFFIAVIVFIRNTKEYKELKKRMENKKDKSR